MSIFTAALLSFRGEVSGQSSPIDNPVFATFAKYTLYTHEYDHTYESKRFICAFSKHLTEECRTPDPRVVVHLEKPCVIFSEGDRHDKMLLTIW